MVIPSEHLSLLNHATLPPKYPLFVKPATEGSSKGIDRFNKVNNYAELELAVQKLKAKFPGQDILVESFLSGREFTVSILGTGPCSRVIGIREHIWQTFPENGNGYQATQEFACWKSKLSEGCLLRYNDAHDMDDAHVKAACQVALDTWTALGCRDAGRVDIRFSSDDANGVPNVLEVSALAGLAGGESSQLTECCSGEPDCRPASGPLAASSERRGERALVRGAVDRHSRERSQPQCSRQFRLGSLTAATPGTGCRLRATWRLWYMSPGPQSLNALRQLASLDKKKDYMCS